MIASMSDAIFDHELIESLFQYEISITSQLTFVKLPVGTELLPTVKDLLRRTTFELSVSLAVILYV